MMHGVQGPGAGATDRGPVHEILNKVDILVQRKGAGIMTKVSRLIALPSIALYLSPKGKISKSFANVINIMSLK